MQLLFPLLQRYGRGKDDGHWFTLCLNLKAKRFEVLDSMRCEGDSSMIDFATRIMEAIKAVWLISYSSSRKQIEDYELVYIDVMKQDNP